MPVNVRFVSATSEDEARRLLQQLGVDPGGVVRMAPKMLLQPVLIDPIPCRAANILKQEMLSLGGDAAVARGSVACTIPDSPVLLIGSRKQLGQLVERLPAQPFGLKGLASELRKLLELSPPRVWKGAGSSLVLDRPRIVGILNLTPDSFSDGGKHRSLDALLRSAEQMVADGVDMFDVGGESTRPGSTGVSAEEELRRVIPAIEALTSHFAVPVSIDTTKARVAAAAVESGAGFVNDVSGYRFDPDMAVTVARTGAGVVLMHTSGPPQTMQGQTAYRDLVGDVYGALAVSMQEALAAGTEQESVVLDPGIGFGKDTAGNLQLLREIATFSSLGCPLYLGTSRKRFLGEIAGITDPAGRDGATAATVALGVSQGVSLFRVHNVAAAREAALVAEAVSSGRMIPRT